jgi:undecaprenyl-diphosphatase
LDIIHVIVLALVQGLTEFLPISSSAHLILVPILSDWPDQGLAFDVAVHVGTLSAVVLYFRRELKTMIIDWFGSLRGNHTLDSRLAWAVLFGTIPVGLSGLIFQDFIGDNLRTPLVIASTTIIFGLVLWVADRNKNLSRDEHSIGWKDVLIIGVAQAIALIPGTSRSGITISAAMLLGMKRQAAARFSFLLSIPVIVLAGGLETLDYLEVATVQDVNYLLMGAMISAVSAFACIHYFLKFIENMSMLPFIIYRMCLGILLFAIFL